MGREQNFSLPATFFIFSQLLFRDQSNIVKYINIKQLDCYENLLEGRQKRRPAGITFLPLAVLLATQVLPSEQRIY